VPLSVDHVGVVVDNLDKAVEWYVQAFQARVFWREDPTDVPPEIVALSGEPHVRLRGALLELLGGTARFELHQYFAPAGADATTRRTCDLGIGHIAFAADDIHAEYERLAALGVRWCGKPHEITTGTLAGVVTAYGFDPFGTTLEICSMPEHLSGRSKGASAAG